jgi:hypothetical protein
MLTLTSFGVYLAGPTHHTVTLVTQESHDLAVQAQGSFMLAIMQPQSIFQTQFAYSNLTSLVLNQSLTFSVSVLNGTARVSLVTLGVSGDLFKTVIPLQTLLIFDNVTFVSRSLRFQPSHGRLGRTQS